MQLLGTRLAPTGGVAQHVKLSVPCAYCVTQSGLGFRVEGLGGLMKAVLLSHGAEPPLRSKNAKWLQYQVLFLATCPTLRALSHHHGPHNSSTLPQFLTLQLLLSLNHLDSPASEHAALVCAAFKHPFTVAVVMDRVSALYGYGRLRLPELLV